MKAANGGNIGQSTARQVLTPKAPLRFSKLVQRLAIPSLYVRKLVSRPIDRALIITNGLRRSASCVVILLDVCFYYLTPRAPAHPILRTAVCSPTRLYNRIGVQCCFQIKGSSFQYDVESFTGPLQGHFECWSSCAGGSTRCSNENSEHRWTGRKDSIFCRM